jgi:transcriptional regulator with XRE-family HTH domain
MLRAGGEMKPESRLLYRQVGARIEQIRTALGITQEELSKKVGLTRTSITNIEAGRQVITLDGLLKFCESFHITPKQLLRGIWF